MALTTGSPLDACWDSGTGGVVGGFFRLGGRFAVSYGNLVSETCGLFGIVTSGGGSWAGSGPVVRVSILGATGGAAAFWFLWNQHPVRNQGSTHATILAGILIPQALSQFQHSPVADAGVPSPWLREEFAI